MSRKSGEGRYVVVAVLIHEFGITVNIAVHPGDHAVIKLSGFENGRVPKRSENGTVQYGGVKLTG